MKPVTAEFNHDLIDDFRAHAGEVTKGPFAGRPILLLTTIDDAGLPYVVPLSYTRDGEAWIVLASYAGSRINPRWFRNLRVRPRVTIEVGSQRLDGVAEVPTGPERSRLFAQHAAQLPQFEAYQERTSREIPVVRLRPEHQT
jgi:deazaflavin-dependent oxidoreductase (nitroreductase family)